MNQDGDCSSSKSLSSYILTSFCRFKDQKKKKLHSFFIKYLKKYLCIEKLVSGFLFYSTFIDVIFIYLFLLLLQVALLAWLISSLIVIINTYYLVTGFVNLLLHSGLQTLAIVFAGVFGFSAMLIYIAAILYLVFRRNRNSTQPLLQDDANNSVYNLPREDIANMQLPQKRSTQDLD